ncbi:TetR family transcriptional regulator [Amycolatopsis cihanbeyliensis]|uniref:TetR family transcriptional regulator n=1 Tax=Amycolatopsis cihanbeyliensis TaxID=1128664 RepID=A0A542CUI0_AMYCI|nr:TetR family transcriptional regulator [Amycolatopsis cihanbeyliensis]TQI94485.1 TetR family transcriptional regulator [Amycolatopsis cihanbeyliensis]
MDEQTASDTRSRILTTARELFAEQGYEQTSVRQIAVRLDVSKATVLYHFSSKVQILATLVTPMLDDAKAVLDAAEKLEPDEARWVVVTGLLDGILENLPLLGIFDGWWLMREPLLRRVVDQNTRTIEIIAGPGAGLRERVRASAVLALLARPAMHNRDAPVEDVRREVLDAARQLFDDGGDRDDERAGTAAPGEGEVGRAPRGRRGRRTVMTGERVARARRMYAAGTHTVDEIARATGVSRATLYRHLNEVVSGQQYSETI